LSSGSQVWPAQFTKGGLVGAGPCVPVGGPREGTVVGTSLTDGLVDGLCVCDGGPMEVPSLGELLLVTVGGSVGPGTAVPPLGELLLVTVGVSVGPGTAVPPLGELLSVGPCIPDGGPMVITIVGLSVGGLLALLLSTGMGLGGSDCAVMVTLISFSSSSPSSSSLSSWSSLSACALLRAMNAKNKMSNRNWHRMLANV